jgi:hypothetical protein
VDFRFLNGVTIIMGYGEEKFSSFEFKEITYIKIIISPPIKVIIIRNISQ